MKKSFFSAITRLIPFISWIFKKFDIKVYSETTVKKFSIHIFKKKLMSCEFCERRVHPLLFPRKWFFSKNQIYRSSRNGLKKNFSKKFLARTPKSWLKNWALLFLVVATKIFYRIVLYCLVGAHLKNFLPARAATSPKKLLNY